MVKTVRVAGRTRGTDGVSRAAVLTALRAASLPLTVTDLAAEVGRSVNAVRFHLDRLVDDGLVRAVPERSDGRPGRPRLRYRAMPPEAVEAVASYRLLAGLLAEQVVAAGGAEAALETGRRWADGILDQPAGRPPEQDPPAAGPVPAADRVAELLHLLDEGGFAPRAVDDGGVLELHACPFMDLARERSDVVCTMHLGLVRRLLERWGLPSGALLTPVLDGSGPCLVRLRPRPTG